jgi:hypothetical protein
MPVLAINRPLERKDARHIINRTALVIIAAQKEARSGQVYAGLGGAVAHQRYARELFRKGFYLWAINHSLRGRVLAVQVIRRNKGAEINEATLDKVEKFYIKKLPPDKELDRQIAKDAGQDDAAVDVNIEEDID